MVYCWAHARRKLKEVFGHNGSEIAAEGLHRIAEFYAVKADIRGVSPGQRLSARQARTAPLYVPLVARLDLGIDMQMVWFGILYTMTSQIAYITPPFGYNLFLMRGCRVALNCEMGNPTKSTAELCP